MPYEIDWKIVIPIILAVFGLFTTLIFKRYELINHKSKHYNDRLDSSMRYFKEFFESTEHNQIVLDRAAQDLARCKSVNANLTNRLIEYHQNYLADFDEIVDLFDNGIDYINFNKNKHLNVKNDLQLKSSKMSLKMRNFLYYSGYVFFFLFGSFFIYLLSTRDTGIVTFLFYMLMCMTSFVGAFGFLMQQDKYSSAAKFIKKLYEVEEVYIALPRKISIILPRERSTKNQ